TLTRVKPAANPKATDAETLRDLILAGDQKGCKEFLAKLDTKQRQAIWDTYKHQPFAGEFKNEKAKLTLTVTVNPATGEYKATLQGGDKTRACASFTPEYARKQDRHDPAKPFAGGPPLLLDLLAAFGQKGYDLWLNTFLTDGVRKANGVSVRAEQVAQCVG